MEEALAKFHEHGWIPSLGNARESLLVMNESFRHVVEAFDSKDEDKLPFSIVFASLDCLTCRHVTLHVLEDGIIAMVVVTPTETKATKSALELSLVCASFLSRWK